LNIRSFLMDMENDSESPNRLISDMKPSYIIIMIMTVAGISASMPLLGPIINHTKYRRAVVRISAIVRNAMIFIKMFISEKLWFVASILQIFVAFTYCVHALTTFSYLPVVKNDGMKLATYSGSFQVAQYFAIAMTTATMLTTASDVIAARLSQLFLVDCWIFDFCMFFFVIKRVKLTFKI